MLWKEWIWKKETCWSRQRDTISRGWKFGLNNLAAKGLNAYINLKSSHYIIVFKIRVGVSLIFSFHTQTHFSKMFAIIPFSSKKRSRPIFQVSMCTVFQYGRCSSVVIGGIKNCVETISKMDDLSVLTAFLFILFGGYIKLKLMQHNLYDLMIR